MGCQGGPFPPIPLSKPDLWPSAQGSATFSSCFLSSAPPPTSLSQPRSLTSARALREMS
jgi:hypothetical protein